MQKYITVSGARQHNLKNISLNIPRNQFVVFTGVSGSGKSSLAFDTLYAEGISSSGNLQPPCPAVKRSG
ncbi:UvrABC system protein A [compost metagenome]